MSMKNAANYLGLFLLFSLMIGGVSADSFDVDCATEVYECVSSAEICDDGIDNDCDSYIDCDDSDCGPCVEIRVDKVVCDSESDLPNWGTTPGVPFIDSTTASDYVAINSDNCRIEPWSFQWGRDVSNPGNNYEGIASGWTSFASGTSFTIYNADEGTLWFRESVDADYYPFSGNDDNVSAEFYCDGDSFKYDNYDYMQGSEIED